MPTITTITGRPRVGGKPFWCLVLSSLLGCSQGRYGHEEGLTQRILPPPSMDVHEELPPPNKVVRAFCMSVLTGPDEGYVMLPRGLFGVSVWEILSPENRLSTITDLVEMFVWLTESEKDRLRRSLASKTNAVRDEIRSALKIEQLSDAALARIGL